MVRDVSLSWFRHGSSWFVMFHCHGFIMVRHGSSWFHHGLSLFVMFHFHGFIMARHGSLSWFRHGS